MSLEKRWPWLYPLLIVIIFVIVYVNVYDKKIAILGDNATYYVLGKGLSEFAGFVNYASPNKAPHNHFPPGYPFLLSIIMFISSDDIQLMKFMNGVLALGIGLLSFLIVKRLTSKPLLAGFISVAIIMNAELLYYSSIMMSEVPFAFFTVLALFLLVRMPIDRPFFKNLNFFIILFLIVYSFYIRAFGVALLGGAVVFLLFRKKISYAVALLIGFFTGILPWQIRSYQLGGSSQLNVLFRKNFYRQEEGTIETSDLLERIVSNFDRIFSIELPQSILPILDLSSESTSSFTKWIIGLAFVAVIIYGVKKTSLNGILLGSYFVFTLAILFVWPDYFSSQRYLVPVIPILSILFYIGLYEFMSLVFKKYFGLSSFNPAFLFVFFLFFLSPIRKLSQSAKQNYPIQWAEFFAMAKWTKEKINDKVVICSRKPYLFYLFSGHTSCNYRYTENDLELLDGLNVNRVDYVVYDQLGFGTTPRCLGNAINKHKDRFNVIQYAGPENRRTYFFKYQRENSQ